MMLWNAIRKGGVAMYSPKIREDLIPHLYRVAKSSQMPMTKIVDNIIRPRLMEIHEETTEYNFLNSFSKTRTPDEPLIPCCCVCYKVRDRKGVWREINIPDSLRCFITHTYCEECVCKLSKQSARLDSLHDPR